MPEQVGLFTEAGRDDPMVVDGVEVVPANANAVLKIIEAQGPGLTHRASLAAHAAFFIFYAVVSAVSNCARCNVREYTEPHKP
jgi:hypothetical protein